MVADYKATSKAGELAADQLYPGYRRQAEIHQFLVAQQGLSVNYRAWFVWTNGIKTAECRWCTYVSHRSMTMN